ncbi:organic cation/carnitine transporter 2 [Cocos nucifera]|uniref:H(+)/Pi cotransporter n=1 Tax=Cocos nucifera TaxID=13894 RepID=A0A8K0ICT1_COCNU|nr:organic cation/carnitine transporter 2 [Cocos nucifera]
MADSTPLLPPYTHSETQHPIRAKKEASPSFDDAIEHYVGSTSLSQLFQAFFASLAWVFDAQQTFINVFTDAEPNWHCIRTDDLSCSSAGIPCSLPKGSWAWDLPKHTSIVSEWNLECSGSALAGLPASAYFIGCLIGGLLLATLADSLLGRKKMLFYSCLTMSLAGTLTVISPNIWVYSALRFICGFGRATVVTCALVLSTEIVSKKWRDGVSIIGFVCFGLGFLSLPAMAYVNRGSSWRTLYLWTSVPSFCYSILLYFLVQESPRWLLVRGRREEAIHILKNIAASNGNVITSSFSTLVTPEDVGNVGIFTAMKILWEKRWAFRRLMAIMTVAFGVGMVYYGMPLNVGNLTSNIYLSVTYNALAELPSSLITFFCIENLNRKSSSLILTTLSGMCSILCVFMKIEGLKMAVEVVSFFSACTALNVALVYSIELFPTCVRNSAISMVRQALVLGGVFAPILVVEGRKKSFLSFGVFGLVIGCCGLFAACLPETRGRSICDTMEEEEYKEISTSENPSVV